MKRIFKLFILSCIFLLLISCGRKGQTKDSPDFIQESDFDGIDWDKKAVEFGEKNMIGNKNKSGVIGMNMPSLEEQKWMWHLWGNGGSILTVVGFHKQTEMVNQILTNGWSVDLGGPNNGADAHAPSNVEIPKLGEWAFLLYSDGVLFDPLVYEIDQ